MGRKRKTIQLANRFNVTPYVCEVWTLITDKSVPGVMPNAYYISTFGRVYSAYSNRCLNLVLSNTGYYRVFLRHTDGTGLYHLVHRILMIEYHYIPEYNEMQVNHMNGIKTVNCNNNLEWVTPQENITHAINTGLKQAICGEDCSYANITNEQADTIARMISEQKYSHKEIADIVGCPIHTVDNISAGSIWKYYYNKYELYKYKKGFTLYLSDDDVHKLCKYFEDNRSKYDTNSDLFRAALKDLFNIEYTNSMSATLCRIINRKTRTNISSQYKF